jgi:two-component system, LuxR family, sensor kinase FixL
MSQLLLGGVGSAQGAQTLQLPGVVRLTFSVLLVSAGYYVGGIVGILLGFPPSGIAAIWPSTAILLAALLLTPPRHWWLYLLATVPTHLHLVANFQRPEVPFVVMLCQVGSNAIHALLAALAVRFVIGAPPRFDSLRNMTAFILLAGIATTAVACTLAVALFMLTGWTTEFWLAWRQRVLAHMFPIITIAPLIVLTFAGRIVSAQPARQRDYVELALLAGGLLAVCIPVFGWPPPGTGIVPVLLLAPLPFLLWAAVRLGPGALSIALLIVAGASITNASVGHGPFVAQSPAENVLALTIFLSAISIPLMLLTALVEERRRTEERLKQSEERMAFAVTSANIGLWQLDNETGCFWATEHCRSMFALPRDTPLTSEALLDAVHPEDRRAATEGIRRAIDDGVPAVGEFRVLLPDGQTRWIFARCYAPDDKQDRRIQVGGVFADITARKKAEHEAEQRMSELAHVNRHATVGELSASLAHELSQPLGAVLANAETVEQIVSSPSPDIEGIKEILADIKRDSMRAGDVIHRVRGMLKKAPSEVKNLNLNDVVGEVFDFLSVQASARDVILSNVPAPQKLQVNGDPIQIQQVVLNLVVNGMDAMAGAPNGQRKIIGRTAQLDDAFAEISISDSGPGISADNLEKVFDPFFTTKPEGMGMGLSIARTIIEAHGGRIWAENQATGGAVFRLALPLAKSVQGSASKNS